MSNTYKGRDELCFSFFFFKKNHELIFIDESIKLFTKLYFLNIFFKIIDHILSICRHYHQNNSFYQQVKSKQCYTSMFNLGIRKKDMKLLLKQFFMVCCE